MTDSAVPDYQVIRAWYGIGERCSNCVQQMVTNVRSTVVSSGCGNSAGLYVDGIDLGSTLAQKALRQETIAATYIQDVVTMPYDFGVEKTALERTRLRGILTKSQVKKAHLTIEMMGRRVRIPQPLPAKATLVVKSNHPQKQVPTEIAPENQGLNQPKNWKCT
jgi:hypothetical protein